MAVYTLVITGSDGHQHTTLSEFASDEMAVGDARGVVTEEHRSIAVGRGAGEAVEYLGAWDWAEDGVRWSPDE